MINAGMNRFAREQLKCFEWLRNYRDMDTLVSERLLLCRESRLSTFKPHQLIFPWTLPWHWACKDSMNPLLSVIVNAQYQVCITA